MHDSCSFLMLYLFGQILSKQVPRALNVLTSYRYRSGHTVNIIILYKLVTKKTVLLFGGLDQNYNFLFLPWKMQDTER